jgi:hypothetical protein
MLRAMIASPQPAYKLSESNILMLTTRIIAAYTIDPDYHNPVVSPLLSRVYSNAQ